MRRPLVATLALLCASSPATTVKAAPSPVVPEDAIASFRRSIVGRWTETGDCSKVAQFFPDGRVILMDGSASSWSVRNTQLIVGPVVFRMQTLTSTQLELEGLNGRRSLFTRCPQSASGSQERVPSWFPEVPTSDFAQNRWFPKVSTNESTQDRTGRIQTLPVGGTAPKGSVYDAAETCGRTLQSGEWLRAPPMVAAIYHEITVKNGSNGPAIVKIIDEVTRASSLFYVARGGVGTVRVNDGHYRFQYAVGGRLAADCETVLKPKGVAEFDKLFELRVQREPDGYSTSTLELTLYEVPRGNITAEKISVQEFNRD